MPSRLQELMVAVKHGAEIVSWHASGQLVITNPQGNVIDAYYPERAEFITALANNADAFKALWDAADALDGGDNYVDSGGHSAREFWAAVEALRPLCGED